MIKIKETEAGGLYLFQGRASANSLFIESAQEAQKFLSLFDRYLGNYVNLLDHCFCPEGWNLIVKLKSKPTILSHYQQHREKSKTAKVLNYTEVWRIISERVRIFLFQYVKWSNTIEGRKGSKVYCRYERYVFDHAEEAKEYIVKMREQMIDLSQSKACYKPDLCQYDQDLEILNNIDNMSSKTIQEAKSLGENSWVKKIIFWGNDFMLLSKWHKKTCRLHEFQFFPSYVIKI